MNSVAPSSTTQRLFFALWPDPELSRQLHELAGKVLRSDDGRRVGPENIHLTLAFLGSVNESFRQCAEAAATAVRAPAFTLPLEQLGCFSRAGILWVGPKQAPAPLLDLVRRLNTALAVCGHEADSRPYAAHLTLARKVHAHHAKHPVEPRTWEVDRFHLVQSRTHADGARYEILNTWELE